MSADWYKSQLNNRNYLSPLGFKLELELFDGVDFFSSTGTTPVATHIFYSNNAMNNLAYMPSTILTSITNTDGSAIPVKCQGKVNASGNLSINRSHNASQAGSPSTVIWTEIAT